MSTQDDLDTTTKASLALGVTLALGLVGLAVYRNRQEGMALDAVRSWDSARYPRYNDFLEHASLKELTADLPGLGEEVNNFANSWDADGPMVLHNRYMREAVDSSAEAIVMIGKQLPKTVQREAMNKAAMASEAARAQREFVARGATVGGRTQRITPAQHVPAGEQRRWQNVRFFALSGD